MNYSADTPIKTTKEDLLGRSTFATQLAEAICKADAKEGLVIGLYGKWGVGKTSIINMIEEQIKGLENTEDKPIVVKFSPWNYSDKNNLISLFFESLKVKLKNYEKDSKNLKKVGEFLANYANSFELLSVIPGVGAPLGKLLEILTKESGKYLAKEESLDEAKDKLNEALLLTEQKILIVIDDIDRLTNSQIQDIFQLVKQVANFPNLIYLLVMDREVVSRALKEIHNVDGEEYLEKIVQIPIEVPSLSKRRVNEIFFSKLDQVIGNNRRDREERIILDDVYWSNVFWNCISPYINTLRDVNRVINVFQFRYKVLCKETAFEDMVAITTLEVLEPKLYKWIFANKAYICYQYLDTLSLGYQSKNRSLEVLEIEFKELGVDSGLAQKCVSTLFPFILDEGKSNTNTYHANLVAREKMRIANSDKFDLYFSFNLSDIQVERKMITQFIHQFDREQMEHFIEIIKFSGEENVEYCLKEIEALKNEIPYQRLETVIWGIVRLVDELTRAQKVYFGVIPQNEWSVILIEDLLVRIKSEENRISVIEGVFRDSRIKGEKSFPYFIRDLEMAHGKIEGRDAIVEKQFVSLKKLERFEDIFLNWVKVLIDLELILDNTEFQIIYYVWKMIDKKGAIEYIRSLLEDDINKLKFISAMSRLLHAKEGGKWACDEDGYAEYIKPEDVYILIQKYKTKMEKFSEEQQIKLASFLLNYDRKSWNNATIEDAKRLLEEWRA